MIRALVEVEDDAHFRDFLRLAFAAIVRRVSNAYDGEVRPHFNPSKRERSVLKLFFGKGH